jgi:hypothetical protein
MSPRSDRPRGPARRSGRGPARALGPETDLDAADAWGERTLLDATGPASRPASRSGSPERRTAARRRQRVPFAVLLVGVIAAGMCALLALNTATAASEVRERHIDAANSSLSAKQEQLSRSLANVQAPAALSKLAAKLGLVPAGSPAFLRVNADGTMTVLGAPAKVPTPPVPLTAAQKAAARAAIAQAATAKAIAKAAKDKAAKEKAAKDKAAKAAKTTAPKTPATITPTSGAPSSGAPTGPKASGPKPSGPKPSGPSATTPHPAKTTSPVPTVTLPGGPR